MNKQHRFPALLLVVATIFFFLTSCSKTEKEETNQETTTSTETAPSEAVPEQAEAAKEPEGLKLMKASDCFTCHQQEATIVGPSFKMIEEKYPLTDGNVSNLTDKVIKGGQGVWGQVAMPNHPNLDKADAEKMVRYILSL